MNCNSCGDCNSCGGPDNQLQQAFAGLDMTNEQIMEALAHMIHIARTKKLPVYEDGINVAHIPNIKDLRRNRNIKRPQLLQYIDLYQTKVSKMTELKKKILTDHRRSSADLHSKMFKSLNDSQNNQTIERQQYEQKINELQQQLNKHNNTIAKTDMHEYTAQQIENLFTFQTKLLQRIKQQKNIIQEFEAGKKLKCIAYESQPQVQAQRKSIQSPLEFLYFMYAPSHCKPFENIKISVEKQMSLLKYYSHHKFNCNVMHIVKPFIDLGMTELNNYERACSFYCILFQFMKEMELFEINNKSASGWDEFSVSRCLYQPMTQFECLFSETNDQSVFGFIYDLIVWIIENKHTFTTLQTLFNKSNSQENNNFAVNIIKSVYSNSNIDINDDINNNWIAYLNKYWIPHKILCQLKKYDDNNKSLWRLIFRQKILSNDDENIQNNKECFFENGVFTKNFANPDENLYSILNVVDYDLYRDNNHRLIFLMLWPNITHIDCRCQCQGMIWYQQSSPMNTIVNGYEQIMVPYPGMKNVVFGGIAKSENENEKFCLCNGSIGDATWWYAIGALINWKNKYIPGPVLFDKGIPVKHTELYIFDIKYAIDSYANKLLLCADWIARNIAIIIAEMIFDRTNIIKQSLSKLYPLTLDISNNN